MFVYRQVDCVKYLYFSREPIISSRKYIWEVFFSFTRYSITDSTFPLQIAFPFEKAFFDLAKSGNDKIAPLFFFVSFISKMWNTFGNYRFGWTDVNVMMQSDSPWKINDTTRSNCKLSLECNWNRRCLWQLPVNKLWRLYELLVIKDDDTYTNLLTQNDCRETRLPYTKDFPSFELSRWQLAVL